LFHDKASQRNSQSLHTATIIKKHSDTDIRQASGIQAHPPPAQTHERGMIFRLHSNKNAAKQFNVEEPCISPTDAEQSAID
jgi:hypothetical protein